MCILLYSQSSYINIKRDISVKYHELDICSFVIFFLSMGSTRFSI